MITKNFEWRTPNRDDTLNNSKYILIDLYNKIDEDIYEQRKKLNEIDEKIGIYYKKTENDIKLIQPSTYEGYDLVFKSKYSKLMFSDSYDIYGTQSILYLYINDLENGLIYSYELNSEDTSNGFELELDTTLFGENIELKWFNQTENATSNLNFKNIRLTSDINKTSDFNVEYDNLILTYEYVRWFGEVNIEIDTDAEYNTIINDGDSKCHFKENPTFIKITFTDNNGKFVKYLDINNNKKWVYINTKIKLIGYNERDISLYPESAEFIRNEDGTFIVDNYEYIIASGEKILPPPRQILEFSSWKDSKGHYAYIAFNNKYNKVWCNGEEIKLYDSDESPPSGEKCFKDVYEFQMEKFQMDFIIYEILNSTQDDIFTVEFSPDYIIWNGSYSSNTIIHKFPEYDTYFLGLDYCENLTINDRLTFSDKLKNNLITPCSIGGLFEGTNLQNPINISDSDQSIFIDTSNVTDMSYMFYNCINFNQPINFDTSKVKDMSSMFYECHNFNQPINFDTSKVEDMNSMFYDCINFNQPINFDTSNVKDMNSMFYDCHNFNQPINFSDTSKVEDMRLMFYECYVFNQPINFSDTSKVEDMSLMFYSCRNFNQDLESWDTSNVTKMDSMFQDCHTFNQPLNWDTSKVKDMSSMFYSCYTFNQPLNWDTSKVTNMSYLFFRCYTFNQPLNWDTSKVDDMRNMFGYCHTFNQPLNWDTSKVDDMSYLFYECDKFNQPLNWDTSKVEDMNHMFYDCINFNQPLNWDTSKVDDMNHMFYGCHDFNQPLNWNTSEVINMDSMFYNCYNFNQDLESWDTSNVDDMYSMFYGCENFNQDLESWDTSNVDNMNHMFDGSAQDPLPSWYLIK